ncbi:MAG: hypothetical protein JSR87_12110 [Proteobacteria bacterium]|nr:hypothetical protein [Pseudomonadota bacterium]MBS0572493.1 hypothetical protein [Pseudomonadota bacterium]
MKRPAAALCLALMTLTLADCGRIRDSRLNPFNWFGHSRASQATATLAPGEAADGRQLMPQVTGLEVTHMPEGAIVRATGLPPTQGWWKAALVAENHGLPLDGVMTYRFLVFQPPGQEDVSTPQSREISAAAYISTVRLADVTRIVVLGETNSRESRR